MITSILITITAKFIYEYMQGNKAVNNFQYKKNIFNYRKTPAFSTEGGPFFKFK